MHGPATIPQAAIMHYKELLYSIELQWTDQAHYIIVSVTKCRVEFCS